MATKIPEIINSCAVYVDGVGFIATAASVENPKIEFEQFEGKSGVAGFKVGTTILKPMEAKFELNEINFVYFTQAGLRNALYATIWTKVNTEIDGKVKNVVFTYRGTIDSLELPKIELGAEAKCSFTLNTKFFSVLHDKLPLVLVDVDNMICALGGVDIWAEHRSFLKG
ncbi:MAG: phage major tail tube protein [Helicobacteraceae bacterium]|jgi:P2 family phage contractile tail tube protein|nr:phage major tail tube protein [Helicobacteraceae bacterium]